MKPGAVFVAWLAVACVACSSDSEPVVVVATLFFELPAPRILGSSLPVTPSVDPILTAQREFLQGEPFHRRAIPGDERARLGLSVGRVKDAPLLKLDFRDRDEARARRSCQMLLRRYLDERPWVSMDAQMKGQSIRMRVIDGCVPVVVVRTRS